MLLGKHTFSGVEIKHTPYIRYYQKHYASRVEGEGKLYCMVLKTTTAFKDHFLLVIVRTESLVVYVCTKCSTF